MKWLAVGVALTAMAATDAALVVVGRAAQDDTQAVNYSLYNGRVDAAADREQVTTENDVGFSGGAVNNFYPMAQVDVALAGASAAASPFDTGPLAQAVFGGQKINQPQYVRAQYPGDQDPPGFNAGSATASASVTQASGTASSTYGAVGNTTTAPLNSHPDGSDAGTAQVSSYFDPSVGFVTIGDARVHHASYMGGMVVIDNLHISVEVTTRGDGVFSKKVSVTVGSASVTLNGTTIPVTIDQNGVSVAGNQVAPLDQIQAVSAQLNQQLAAAGVTVHAVDPQVAVQGPNLHIEAEGVIVNVQQVGTPQGIPKQSVRHTLGEVVMDNEAIAAPPAVELPPVVPPPPPVITNNSSSTTTIVTTINNGSSGSQPAAPTPAPAAPRVLLRSTPVSVITTEPKPRWLLLAYVAWQMLMIAMAATLYLYRSGLRRVV